MKFKFEVIQRQPRSKDANYIVAVVIPFWARREDDAYNRNVLTGYLRDLEKSTHVEDALFCTCHFDGSEFFPRGTSINDASIRSLSDRLVASLVAVRENARVEYRKPSSSSVEVESNKLSSESDAKDHGRLPIVFIAHSLASWVVRHLLCGTPYDNTTIMFATRGVVFLDTPREGSVKSEKVEEYLKGLNTFLRGKTGTRSSMQVLVKELTDIDLAFERLQNTAFVHRKKAHVMGGPAIAICFSEIWTTASDSGIMTFSKRHSNQNRIGLNRLRSILRIETEEMQLERAKLNQGSHGLRLDSLVQDILRDHRRLHEHEHEPKDHSGTQAPAPNNTVLPVETHSILFSGGPVQTPEAIPEGVGLSLARPIRKSSQDSGEDSRSTNRSPSPDPLGDSVSLSRQGSVSLGRLLRQNRRDSSGDGISITSERSDITQPVALKSSFHDPAYGRAYKETIRLANSYYQRADFVNAGAAFQRSKELLEAAMGPSARQSFQFIAIDEQLAAISMYRGQYSKSKIDFEELLKTTKRLEQIPSIQKKELVQDLRRWIAVVLLHQGQHKDAVSRFKALLEDEQADDCRTTPTSQRMLRIHVLRDLSLALAHVEPYSKARKQIKSAEDEIQKLMRHEDSAPRSMSYLAPSEPRKELNISGAAGIKPSAQLEAPAEDKTSRIMHRKLSVKREYLYFVQAVISCLWGLYDTALEKCEEAMHGLEERLGGRHMKTLECASLKALLLAKNYRLSAAENCCNQTLKIMRRELGPRHPHTLETTGHLVYIFASQYRLTEATATALSLQKSTEMAFGDYHPHALKSRLLLSQARLATGDYIEALGELRKLVKSSESFYGEENLINITHDATYCRALHHAGALKEAERVAKLTLQRESIFFSLPNGLGIQIQEISSSFQRIIKDRLEAMDRKADDWRIHPLLLSTLETIALIELSKTNSDRASARDLLGSCWGWKSRVLGKDHAFTLTAEYEFAMAFEDEDESNEETSRRQQHMRHVYLRRVATLKETHPDILTSWRELIIINCTLGVWSNLPTPSQARQYVHGEKGDSHSIRLTDIESTGTEMDDEAWARAEDESQKIFALHKMQLGGSHPETLKSHLWLFQLQVQIGRDIDNQTCMTTLLSELQRPELLHQRLVDSVRIRNQMALALLYNGHLRQAARILHQIPEEMKATTLVNDPSFTETLSQLRETTQKNILETIRKAQKHPKYKTRLQELRHKVDTSMKANSKCSETLEDLSEIFELCELLYGPEHSWTLSAREKLVLASWDPQDESKMREAIKLMTQLVATLKANSSSEKGEELAKVHDQWAQELNERTKEVELEDELED